MRRSALLLLGTLIVLACTRSSLDLGGSQTGSPTAPPATPTPTGAPNGGYYRKPITVSSTLSGSSGTLPDFPLLVMTTDADLAGHAQVDGSDIVFTATNGLNAIGGITQLASEIERYDPFTGALTAWVRLPALSSTAQAVLFMNYGNASMVVTSSGAAVWSQNFAGVWHLSDDPSRTSLHDSTGNGLNAVVADLTSNDEMAGIAGGSLNFNGSNSVGTVATAPILDWGVGSFAVECWIYIPSTPGPEGQFDMPFWKGGSSNSATGFDMELGKAAWRGNLNDGQNHVQVQFSPSPLLDQWVQLAGVVDREAGTFTGFVNGVAPQPPQPLGNLGSLTSTNPILIGGDAPYFFRGRIDEVRVSLGKQTGPYLRAGYNQATSQSQFVTIGAQQAMTPPLPWPAHGVGSGR